MVLDYLVDGYHPDILVYLQRNKSDHSVICVDVNIFQYSIHLLLFVNICFAH